METGTNKSQFGFVEFLEILVKWKRVIISAFLLVSIFAIILSLILPKYYKATVVFLPPSRSSGLSSLIQNFSVDLLQNNDITGDICLSILKSRRLRQIIIDKYNLMELYDNKYIEQTLKALDNNVLLETEMQVGIGVSNITSISLSVIDKSPSRAANMANDMFDLLEKEIIELTTQKARNNRLFLEERVQRNLAELRKAEETLNAFQEKHGAIEITEQAKLAIETAGRLKAELLEAQIKRETLVPFLDPNHYEIKSLDSQIKALNKEYEALHVGSSSSSNDVLLAIDEIPQLSLDYFRLFKDVEIQNKLQAMLTPLLEQAKIQEAKTIPVLRTIDHAIPPTYKYKPKRIIIVLGIVLVSMSLTVLYIFFLEYLRRIQSEDLERYERILKILHSIQPGGNKYR